MADSAGKFGDLGTRIASAVVMLAVAAAALYAPPPTFGWFLKIVMAVAFWELAALVDPGITRWRRWVLAALPLVVGLLTQFGLSPFDIARVYHVVGGPWGMVLKGLEPMLLGLLFLTAGWWLWAAYGALLMLGMQGILMALVLHGEVGVIGLVLLVAVSDTAAYFAGRMIGGPKFWPRVSPKKTWSGTVAGWIGAALFAVFIYPAMLGGAITDTPMTEAAVGIGIVLAIAGVALSLAGQMGDVAESAMKRRVGVKDASNLIPGHGGVLDRIDALVAAAAVVYVAAMVGA